VAGSLRRHLLESGKRSSVRLGSLVFPPQPRLRPEPFWRLATVVRQNRGTPQTAHATSTLTLNLTEHSRHTNSDSTFTRNVKTFNFEGMNHASLPDDQFYRQAVPPRLVAISLPQIGTASGRGFQFCKASRARHLDLG